ncbi:hypothetical protein GCM10010267_17810 [Streptomyces griseorubens]|nr:hypothetical protein GCM10010267_17810 [Streptomyces griseorubens]
MADWEASQWVEDTMPKVPWRVGRVVNCIPCPRCSRRPALLTTRSGPVTSAIAARRVSACCRGTPPPGPYGAARWPE